MVHALHKAVAASLSASASVAFSRMLFFARRKGDEEEPTSTAAVPRIPPELYSLIASHLRTSPCTLKTCSLVSSDWLAPTRRILFHDVRLRHDNLVVFLSLLGSALCTFVRFVRVLRMREGEYMVDRWVNEGVMRELAATLGGVGGVEWLDVYNVTWRELGVRGVDALVSGFGDALRAVRLSTCYWEGMDEFANFLCSFKGLSHLVCESVLINGDGDEDQSQDAALGNLVKASREDFGHEPASILPSPLVSLYLCLPEEAMLRYFMTQPAVWGVQSLGLVIREPRLIPPAGELVRKAGAAAKDLVLFLPDEGTSYRNYTFTLRQNTALQTLRIRITTPSFISNGYDTTTTTSSSWSDSWVAAPNLGPFSLAWIPELIASTPSPHFETLTFDIDASMELVASWPWCELVHAVESTSIKQVSFVVRHTSSSHRIVRERLKEAVCQLSAGGVSEGRSWSVRGLSKRSLVDGEPWRAWVGD